MNSRLRMRLIRAAHRAHRNPMDLQNVLCHLAAFAVLALILFGGAIADRIYGRSAHHAIEVQQ